MAKTPQNDNASKQHDKAKQDFKSGKTPKQSRDEQRVSTPRTDKPGGPDNKK